MQTAAERKRAERERRKESGLVRLPDRWVHPNDLPAVLAYIEQKNKKRSSA